jgi:hypothetical protein
MDTHTGVILTVSKIIKKINHNRKMKKKKKKKKKKKTQAKQKMKIKKTNCKRTQSNSALKLI